jgi:hypothetical protein
VRFLLDESAEARIAAYLAEHGHDATRVGRDYPASLPTSWCSISLDVRGES